MGNCCRRESSAMVWASVDEIYESMEKESLIVVSDDVNGTATPLKEKVQTKVTKRELEEMVAIARAQDVPVDRVLSRLIHAVDHSSVQSQRSWEPVLDTITE
ncbi:hypothetical protein PHJA_001342900 [Phtheirospermum japonicum]|uniref:Uncharacterized protein n=1 Tax=Phtheirospermum japonicum TaxID=374723 RepID=A0A830C4D4_9LAMI|nr:hypothetical protein PHJA_001342900 [Phtheirospermum japonicum]